MDMLFVCLTPIVIMTIAIILIIIIASKKHLMTVVPNREINSFRMEALQKFRNKDFKIKEKGDKIYIEKGTFTATNIFLIQKNDKIEIYRQNSATTITWILVVVGAFFFLILALVVGIISDSNSKNFAENEILPLLTGKHFSDRICPRCKKDIPFDAEICPYCGNRLQTYI